MNWIPDKILCWVGRRFRDLLGVRSGPDIHSCPEAPVALFLPEFLADKENNQKNPLARRIDFRPFRVVHLSRQAQGSLSNIQNNFKMMDKIFSTRNLILGWITHG